MFTYTIFSYGTIHPAPFCTLGTLMQYWKRIFYHQHCSKQTSNRVSGLKGASASQSSINLVTVCRVSSFFFDAKMSFLYFLTSTVLFSEMYFKIIKRNFWKYFSHFRLAELHKFNLKIPKKRSVVNGFVCITFHHCYHLWTMTFISINYDPFIRHGYSGQHIFDPSNCVATWSCVWTVQI